MRGSERDSERVVTYLENSVEESRYAGVELRGDGSARGGLVVEADDGAQVSLEVADDQRDALRVARHAAQDHHRRVQTLLQPGVVCREGNKQSSVSQPEVSQCSMANNAKPEFETGSETKQIKRKNSLVE